MGYYVNIRSSTCVLPKENQEEAYKIMCDLNDEKNNKMKRGGQYPGRGEKSDFWYSWMDWNYDETCKDAKEILEMLGFYCPYEDGDLHICGYDSKAGQEDIFFSAIAHLLRGEIEWSGEEGEHWKWVFGDGRLKTLAGWEVIFERNKKT